MSTHTTHYPLDPAEITADVFATASGITIASIEFGDGLTITCVDKPGRMHPQALTHRLRELADEIDRKCVVIRYEQSHVGRLVEA